MFTVRLSLSFQRDYKRLIRKYRRLPNDLTPLIEILETGDFSAHDAVKGFAHKIYKARVRSSDQAKGKSGGFRVIYYVVTKNKEVFLLTMYAKARQENIDTKAIKKLMEDLAL